MSSLFRTCILAVMASSSLIACDDQSPDTDLTELRASGTSCTGGPSILRELDDPHDLIFVEDSAVQVLVDPLSAPMDISTGVIEGEATVIVDGPYGSPLKIKLKLVVLPAAPPAE